MKKGSQKQKSSPLETNREEKRINKDESQYATQTLNDIINKNKRDMIFIVEDNTLYANSLQYFLEDRLIEPEIRVFSLGESCIEQLHLNPDYIIMDYFLNSKERNAMDGLDTIREIRKRNADSKIILLSSQKNMDVTVEAVQEHHCNYVAKNEASFEKVYNIIEDKK